MEDGKEKILTTNEEKKVEHPSTKKLNQEESKVLDSNPKVSQAAEDKKTKSEQEESEIDSSSHEQSEQEQLKNHPHPIDIESTSQKQNNSISNQEEKLSLIFEFFKRKQKFLDDNEFFIDDKVTTEQLSVFNRWGEYVLVLNSKFNDLYDSLEEILEKEEYNLEKASKILLLPIFKQRIDKNRNELEKVFQYLNENLFSDKIQIDHPSNLSIILDQIPNSFVASPYEFLGTRFIDTTVSPQHYADLKPHFNTLLIIWKMLYRAKSSLSTLLSWFFSSQKKVSDWNSVLEKYYVELMQSAIDEDRSIDDLKDQRDEIDNSINELIRHNYQWKVDVTKLAEKAQKEYFKYLTKYLFPVVHALHTSIGTIKKENDDESKVNIWNGLFSEFAQLIINYLNEHLQIEVLACNVGDKFDPERHKPFVEAEPDPEGKLEDETIKEIVNVGFVFKKDENSSILISPADVIVVKNP